MGGQKRLATLTLSIAAWYISISVATISFFSSKDRPCHSSFLPPPLLTPFFLEDPFCNNVFVFSIHCDGYCAHVKQSHLGNTCRSSSATETRRDAATCRQRKLRTQEYLPLHAKRRTHPLQVSLKQLVLVVQKVDLFLLQQHNRCNHALLSQTCVHRNLTNS